MAGNFFSQIWIRGSEFRQAISEKLSDFQSQMASWNKRQQKQQQARWIKQMIQQTPKIPIFPQLLNPSQSFYPARLPQASLEPIAVNKLLKDDSYQANSNSQQILEPIEDFRL